MIRKIIAEAAIAEDITATEANIAAPITRFPLNIFQKKESIHHA